ncbi:putative phosphatidylinositol transporter [Meredithblackwellia eburnea MCA 4105]
MSWPAFETDSPLSKLHSQLGDIIEQSGHSSIWGITLSPTEPPAFSTLLVLSKYLRSNALDVQVAKDKLISTLKWRKQFGLDNDQDKYVEDDTFKGLGYVTEAKDADGINRVITWNVYGAVKDPTATFADLDRFLKWRVNLMEQGVLALNLSTTTTPIPQVLTQKDPHQMYQIHDYLNVSFLRMDPSTKAATKATIEVLGSHYPEMLDKKFFVNIPWFMSWVYAAIKLIVRSETFAKFSMLAEGKELAPYFSDLSQIPKAYGGTGEDLMTRDIKNEGGEKAVAPFVAPVPAVEETTV